MDLDAYHRDGYAIIDRLFDPQQVEAICAELSRLVGEADENGRHPSGCWMQFEKRRDAVTDPELQIRKFGDFALFDPFFWDIQQAWRPAISALAPGALLLQSMGMVKPPGIGIAKDWHQDAPYFAPIIDRAEECFGIWVALDQATRENGCMEVVPGSHRRGSVAHVTGPTGPMHGPEETARCRREAVAIEIPAGSALLFHACLDHFTDHNRSAHRRRAIQYHYAPAGSRWLGGEHDNRRVLPCIDAPHAPYTATEV